VIVAVASFSILPKNTPNMYVPISSDLDKPDGRWLLAAAPFGVIQVDDTYYLRWVVGWGT